MRLSYVLNRRSFVNVFILIITCSLGFMLGSLQSLELTQEKAKVTDKLNQLELELYEAERQMNHCDEELGHKMNAMISESEVRTIYAITPVYTRPTQLLELSLLAKSLQHVPFLNWIVVEIVKTDVVSTFLESSNIHFTHLDSGGLLNNTVNKCNVLRSTALAHLGANLKSQGVIIFANTDTVYSLHMFEKVREIKIAGVWPTMFTKEKIECTSGLKLMDNNSNEEIKYMINLSSAGFSTKILESSETLIMDPLKSDTAASSHLYESVVNTTSEIVVMFCGEEVVWHLPVQQLNS